MQNDRSNNELFIQLAAGNEKAFRELFHYYTSRLHPFIFSIVNSELLTEEIIQEVFLKLWVNRHEVAEKENPSAWLFTVASNHALTFLRKKSVERKYIEHAKLLMTQGLSANPVEDRLITREEQSIVEAAIRELTPQQQLVFTLSRKEGLSHKEIAEKLGISQNTVKNHLVTAIKLISQKVKKMNLLLFLFFS